MSSSTIFTLPETHSTSTTAPQTLREQIERGLIGSSELIVPGLEVEDRQWAFKRTVPTVVLYDEEGLRLYDRITSEAPEYYLFPDELNLLRAHGDAIARSMGFPGSHVPLREEEKMKHEDQNEKVPLKPWKPARWGDADVGRWNGGVNGEEGLAGGWEAGWDVVELGAGALRKTAHLLTALSSALPPPPPNSKSLPAPITYHPLDLSYPELDRVLGQMNDAFGDQLEGKVACVGLHGDYEAGLQYIREGKLNSLRPKPFVSQPATSRPLLLEVDSVRDGWSQSNSILQPTTPELRTKGLQPSPPFSPSSAHLVTPGDENSPLPSAITDDDSVSIMGGCRSSGSGTWSPIEDTDSMMNSTRSLPESDGAKPQTPRRPLHLVFLGSSLGNFPRDAAAPFLKSLPLKQGDTFLIGLDGRPEPGAEGKKKVEVAYNDPAGHTKAFEEHGWNVVRQELGLNDDAGVEFVGRYNETLGRHEAYFKSKDRQTIHLPGVDCDVTLEKNELLNIEWSYKYSHTEALDLFQKAELRVIDSWKAPESEYRLWLLERPTSTVTMVPQGVPYSHISNDATRSALQKAKNVPQWLEWLHLWNIWDHITLGMIPKEMLHQKPIDLRHICLFYLGHIPTFLDIHLTRMTKGCHTEPEFFKDIFERGIDPNVDDPTQIHSHSEVPTEEADWPTLDEILAFRDRVRQRLRGIYNALESGEMAFTRHVGRVLFMTYEHEAMHAETLLYMLAQSTLTRPPTAVSTPQWDVLVKRWDAEAPAQKIITIAAGTIELGHQDLEAEDVRYLTLDKWADHELGWDIEHPAISVQVNGFKVESLPISNQDYLNFLGGPQAISSMQVEQLPASWIKVDDEWKIRSLYGPVSFEIAGRWPLVASKNELEAFARSKGGRLPTEAELRRFWEHPEGSRPVGYQANVGFKQWHPIPPAATKIDTDGQILYGHNGGVWEWTSTVFEGYEGFVPSELYPGYSADFFDEKHYVVLGGSFVTLDCIAARKSFRNWYQANYRFSFIGGRVVYDL